MGRFGLVFPGQGSQHPGMAQDLYRNYQSVRDLFADAGQILGRDMASLCFEAPREVLDLTINTQIAVLTADLAAWRVFSGRSAATPLVMAGHSLGEYAALHAAGAAGLGDVFSLVQRRAEYHQEAVSVGEGAMAAVLGLTREEVVELCLEFDGDDHCVALSGDNAPGQTVVSGHAHAVAEVIAAAGKREKGKAIRLPISVPCHCRLLQGAAKRLEADLRQVSFRDGTVPVIPNCDPSLLHSPERTAELLVRQITSPVRWRETIERMAAMGVDTIVELGPKKTLTGLVKRIDPRLRFLNVEDGASLEKTLTALDG
ncbi:MAG: [acyl-carrier-protein] S-malonyltransferase [Syntrophobacterales bacterium RBG_19FT_COMBO_59_10]|nr:MAG: [acyl-carrier-protein] S-malonyltransferase [Syntrophobacterales bacterium RBG_19FT_COMBO_59_10]